MRVQRESGRAKIDREGKKLEGRMLGHTHTACVYQEERTHIANWPSLVLFWHAARLAHIPMSTECKELELNKLSMRLGNGNAKGERRSLFG